MQLYKQDLRDHCQASETVSCCHCHDERSSARAGAMVLTFLVRDRMQASVWSVYTLHAACCLSYDPR